MSISNDVTTTAKVIAINTFLRSLTGERAAMNYGENHVRVVLTPQQKIILQGEIEKQLRAKPGKIRLDYAEIMLPPLFRVYGKFAVMALILAFLAGSITMPTK